MGQAEYLPATEVLGGLQDDEAGLTACLRGLKHAMLGQQKFESGDVEDALIQAKQAETLFEKVPSARKLLGVCKADISAAYGKLEKYDETARYARESISLIGGDQAYAFTEAMAHVKLGTSLFFLGQADEGSTHYEKAKGILSDYPDGQKIIATLEKNVSDLKKLSKLQSGKWWQFWR